MEMEPAEQRVFSMPAGVVDKASNSLVDAESLSAVNTGCATVAVLPVATVAMLIAAGGSNIVLTLGILTSIGLSFGDSFTIVGIDASLVSSFFAFSTGKAGAAGTRSGATTAGAGNWAGGAVASDLAVSASVSSGAWTSWEAPLAS